ncbi:hypothetical protein C8A01DRAFT_18455 [Parachaetomium inaequale]|uniref:Uncharacterized protein n=1 Tax=Parachaetomium inaequale TaxID=2588326 RepID=A0AAN6PAI6_9PEZI|nr:hypothetical protein C8A01DRAFT_18455 [Parachaetomium inaequale]
MAAVAPMDLVVRNDPTSIPLRCTLCPKKPKFSDLSHLLTHISSKSHLAHRFKAELRARDDRAASEEVRQYDDWCEHYGINALLAERMAAKEQKKTGRRGKHSKNAANNKPDAFAILDQDLIKPDPDEYIEPLSATAHWSTVSDQFQDGHHGQFDNSSYPTPFLKRSRSDRSVPSTPENETRVKYYRRWPSEAETTDSVPVSDLPSESTEFDDDKDSSKLKGVRYPGMGLFDSADEIQKRMRNQRKDDSVLKQMEETSSGIVPNEFVWEENGEFQRIRDIYASPSIEGSPDRKFEDRDVPKPKRGRRSAAAAPSGPVRTRASTRLTRQTTSRSKRTQQDDNDGVSGSVDAYDIFRDPPKPTKSVSYASTRDNGAALFTSQPTVSSSHYFQNQHTMGPGTFNPLCVQGRGGYYNPYGYSNFGNEEKASTTNFQAINSMNLGNMSYNGFGGPFASDSVRGAVDQDFDL